MSPRSHLWLRLGALALLATAAAWPRATTRATAAAGAARATELVRTVGTSAAAAGGATGRSHAAPRPHPARLVIADADDARLTN